VNELLAIIGTSWRPLLLFPGLVSALVLAVATSYLWKSSPRPTRWSLDLAATTQAACIVLMLAFLPVPGSPWRYGIDVLVALALVEAPHWHALRRRWRSPDEPTRAGAAADTTALLNVYLVLGLAVAAVSQATGSLVLGDLRGGVAPLWRAGIVGWAACLPPLLALGPWSITEPNNPLIALRRVAHIALLATLALPSDAGYWGLAIAALLAFGSLAALDRGWHGRPESWERAQPVLALLLLLALLYTGTTAWYDRAR
jgi:hypothetical protein